jgi:hypothetical protein
LRLEKEEQKAAAAAAAAEEARIKEALEKADRSSAEYIAVRKEFV